MHPYKIMKKKKRRKILYIINSDFSVFTAAKLSICSTFNPVHTD